MNTRGLQRRCALAFTAASLTAASLGGCNQSEPTTPVAVEIPSDARPEDVSPGKPAPPRAYKSSSRLPAPPPGPPEVR